jgi:primosomal protein N'
MSRTVHLVCMGCYRSRCGLMERGEYTRWHNRGRKPLCRRCFERSRSTLFCPDCDPPFHDDDPAL